MLFGRMKKKKIGKRKAINVNRLLLCWLKIGRKRAMAMATLPANLRIKLVIFSGVAAFIADDVSLCDTGQQIQRSSSLQIHACSLLVYRKHIREIDANPAHGNRKSSVPHTRTLKTYFPKQLFFHFSRSFVRSLLHSTSRSPRIQSI